MTDEEQHIVDVGKAVERLRLNKDFQLAVEREYIESQVLALGKDFDATQDEQDTLKAITHLCRFLTRCEEDAKIILNTMKKDN